jgi:pheromone receptor transcription factor
MNPLEEPLKMKPMDEEEIDSGDESDAKPTRRSGRRKIKIEYIEDKNRRHITFSKRKAGIMKKVR